tara:strand:- start:193 stop:366 length:174 start_codon:yes stop_codon:yes gene_type:complete
VERARPQRTRDGVLAQVLVACVAIKFRAPHAIDAMVSPQLRLLDGVEVHEEIIYLTG